MLGDAPLGAEPLGGFFGAIRAPIPPFVPSFLGPVSNLDPSDMQLLGIATTQRLFWDYSNTECFYVLVEPPEIPIKTLFSVTPRNAQSWYGRQQAQVVYNPFIGSPNNPPSNL